MQQHQLDRAERMNDQARVIAECAGRSRQLVMLVGIPAVFTALVVATLARLLPQVIP